MDEVAKVSGKSQTHLQGVRCQPALPFIPFLFYAPNSACLIYMAFLMTWLGT